MPRVPFCTGHKLREDFLLAVSLLLPGWGAANLVAVLPLGFSDSFLQA